MFMLPATSICPSIGSPTSRATALRPPSAPITYLRPDHVLRSADPVAHPDVDGVVVLHEAEVLGVEPDPAAALRRMPDQQLLQQRLRQVAVHRGAGQPVVGLAGRVRAPGADPADLVAREAGAEHGVAHELVRRAAGDDLVLDAEVPEDLDGPLVGDVRPRGVGRPPVLRDDEVLDPVGGEQQRGRGAGRPAADDEDVGLEDVGGRAGGHAWAPSGARTKSCLTLAHRPAEGPPRGAGSLGPCSVNATTSDSLTPKTASLPR